MTVDTMSMSPIINIHAVLLSKPDRHEGVEQDVTEDGFGLAFFLFAPVQNLILDRHWRCPALGTIHLQTVRLRPQ
jgi:hypothetical protein